MVSARLYSFLEVLGENLHPYLSVLAEFSSCGYRTKVPISLLEVNKTHSQFLDIISIPWPKHSSFFKASNKGQDLVHVQNISFLSSLLSHQSDLLFCLPLLLLKASCDQTGPTQIIQDNLPISKSLNLIIFAKNFLPHEVNFIGSEDQNEDIFEGVIFGLLHISFNIKKFLRGHWSPALQTD